MNLDLSKWKEFKIKDLFEVTGTKTTKIEDLEQTGTGKYPYVTTQAVNNGVAGFYNFYTEQGNVLTIDSAVLGFCSYHEDSFSASDHVEKLTPKFDLNKKIALFLVTLLNKETYRYSYGRKANQTKINDTVIKLPVQRDEKDNPVIDETKKYSEEGFIPDWIFMENFIGSLRFKPIKTKNKKAAGLSFNVDDWKEFTYSELFELKGGYYNKKPEHSKKGNFPFLGSTENNNGVTELYSIEDITTWDKVGNQNNSLVDKIFKGNCIAVTVNGSVCNAFYQTEDFTCSHDITAFYLKNHKLNCYLAMFLCSVIMQDKYRWSYGRKPHNLKKFRNSIIKLPVMRDESGNPIIDTQKKFSQHGFVPDWDFMENYIKALPYADKIQCDF